MYQAICKEEKDLVQGKLKPAFKRFMRENEVVFKDSTYEHFSETLLAKWKEFAEFSSHERILLHEYYLERLKQRE